MNLPPFQRLLDDHGHDVHRFLVATVGRHDADDCYQETWIAALRAYPRLDHAHNLRGWLFTIAARKAIDTHRRRRRDAVAMAQPPEPTPAAAHWRAADGIDSRAEVADDLWAAVAALPAKQRAAVVLRHLLDVDYATVAATMGVSEPAARRNVHEGLKRLREEHGVEWST